MKNIKLFDSVINNEFIYTIIEIINDDKVIIEEYNELTDEAIVKTISIKTWATIQK